MVKIDYNKAITILNTSQHIHLAHSLNTTEINTQKQLAKLYCCSIKGHYLQYQFSKVN